MTMSKDEQAGELARKHYEIETGLQSIYRLLAPAETERGSNEPIKLLEIHELTVPVGIVPLHFGPMPEIGISHPTAIVEITPEEFAQLLRGDLSLPSGWRLGEPIPRPMLEAVA